MGEWQKSSRCESNACVEVGADSGRAQVRDNTDPDGPVLAFGPAAWREFTEDVRAS